MGLIVDNAIVVTEQIHRCVSRGEDLQQAAGQQPFRLFAPLTVSTLTTTVAFLPIYLLPGGTGEFVRAIPVGVGVCLLTSLLVAMTAIPWLFVQLAGKRRGPAGDLFGSGPISVMARPFGGSYRGLIRSFVQQPVTVLLTVVAVLIACASLGFVLRRDFFSPVQRINS